MCHISTIYIYKADKKHILANFKNYSNGIFGNHLSGNGCQKVKFCGIKEVWNKLKNGRFLSKKSKFVKSHFKIGTKKIPKMSR